eukprot:TRINITY_DN813_c0_g1_i1.p2 TRINITY_DN813_c0_g1~~TRINITY_DN813_c0_g1_i1.p2  ORF type:complete len:988 (-),score=216.19 TRINITY_DN813_c0_g1_i1:69-3032(-)
MAKFGLENNDLIKLHQARNGLDDVGGIKGLAEKLKTNLKTGIDKKEVDEKFQSRQEAFGKNQLPSPPETSLLELIWEGLQDSTLILLCVSAVISLILGILENPSHGWIEGTAILVAVFLVVTVTAVNDYQKEKQFRKLNDRKNNKAVKVIRGGEQCQVSIFEINVGDIVIIETGDILCADGLFVDGHNMKCDESAMTGETDAVKKNADEPFLLSGCQVMEGVGKMLVIAVGEHSESGRALALLQKGGDEQTPLQEKLEDLAEKIAHMGLVAAVAIFVILLIKFVVITYMAGHLFEWHMFSVIVKYFITSVTIVVVAVPEGLPLAVTIALAYSMLKMLKDQNLVRHLESCETMGGATTICSDKTGTLTKNQMTVVKAYIAGTSYEKTSEVAKAISKDLTKVLTTGMAINSTAYEGKSEEGKLVFIGSKTETALLNFGKELGCEYKKVRDATEIVQLYPFSSARKRMSTLVAGEKKGNRLYSKGASEIVLSRCTNVMDAEGKTQALDAKANKELLSVIERLAKDGLRTIAIAYRDIEQELKWDDEEAVEKDLTLIGIVGIRDPPRDEVPAAVKRCQSAGIVVRMVTGDNLETAKKIAEECGIYTGAPGIAIEGPVFRAMSDEEKDKIIPNIQVMARSSPADKYTLVTRLKAYGHVVAVTGDGTNDAPALSAAHVGFAMGIAGTEVAKEASDIILMDDNFSSIVKAVMWGRNVYDSIRKFLQFQLTVNVVAVLLAFVGAVTNEHGESPLKPVQLLWVNLIMDTMAALALATEPPTDSLLERQPYGKTDPLITNTMWKMILGQAAYQLIVNLVVLYYGHHIFGVEKDGDVHLTIVFNVFVLCQLFNELNARRIYDEMNVFSGFFTNRIFLAVLAFTVAAQYLIVEFGGEFTSTHSLTSSQWLACVGLGFISLPYGFLLRLFHVAERAKAKIEPPKTPKSALAAKWARSKSRATASAHKQAEQKKNTIFQLLHKTKSQTEVPKTAAKKKKNQ